MHEVPSLREGCPRLVFVPGNPIKNRLLVLGSLFDFLRQPHIMPAFWLTALFTHHQVSRPGPFLVRYKVQPEANAPGVCNSPCE